MYRKLISLAFHLLLIDLHSTAKWKQQKYQVANTFAMKNACIQKRFQESPTVIENIITL